MFLVQRGNEGGTPSLGTGSAQAQDTLSSGSGESELSCCSMPDGEAQAPLRNYGQGLSDTRAGQWKFSTSIRSRHQRSSCEYKMNEPYGASARQRVIGFSTGVTIREIPVRRS